MEFGGGHGLCQQIVHSPGLDRAVHDNRFTATSPMVYCIEPMPANIELLRNCSAVTDINQDYFKIEQFAVGNPKEGKTSIPFPDGRLGSEHLGISASGDKSTWIEIEYKSLDAQFGNLDKVDMLLIDVEGNDPDAIFGGKKLLSKTRYLEFEVSRGLKNGVWDIHTMESVIQFLDEIEFDCFWETKDGELFQITNCWSSLYEKEAFGWGNVVCAKRGDPWHRVLFSIHADQY